jgi:hypothetical protein
VVVVSSTASRMPAARACHVLERLPAVCQEGK